MKSTMAASLRSQTQRSVFRLQALQRISSEMHQGFLNTSLPLCRLRIC